MNLARADRRERLDALAAQYALGTLSARARARLARAARADRVVADAVAGWESRLAQLADGLPPIEPPASVWPAITRRLGFAPAAAPKLGWWDRVALWRSLALAAGFAALVLGVTLLAPREDGPGGTIVAVLAGPDARPVLLATAARRERTLALKALAPVNVPADRALELWMLPGTGAPRSLGVFDPAAPRRVRLAAAPDEALRGIDALAVSLEPRGGSPTGAPTGPVLYVGKLERLD